MKDPKDPKDGLPLDDLDLDAELAKWDEAFDSAHAPASPPPAATALDAPIVPPADPDGAELFGGEIEFVGEGEALGDLLGGSPPLLSPDDDSVLSSAPRPSPVRRSMPPVPSLPAREGDLPPPPTDDEIFGDIDESPFPVSLAEPAWQERVPAGTESPAAALEEESPVGFEEDFGGSTRIASPDEGLLAKLSSPAIAPGAPAAPPRRGPAVVRREELAARRSAQRRDPPSSAEAEGADDFGGFDEPGWSEATRVADVGVAERMLEAHAQTAPPLPAHDPGVAVDEDFYGEIALDASDSAAAETLPRPPPSAPPKRRVSAHVVRRSLPRLFDLPREVRVATPIEEPADAPAPALEIEAEEPEVAVAPPPAAAALGGSSPASVLETRETVVAPYPRPPVEHTETTPFEYFAPEDLQAEPGLPDAASAAAAPPSVAEIGGDTGSRVESEAARFGEPPAEADDLDALEGQPTGAFEIDAPGRRAAEDDLELAAPADESARSASASGEAAVEESSFAEAPFDSELDPLVLEPPTPELSSTHGAPGTAAAAREAAFAEPSPARGSAPPARAAREVLPRSLDLAVDPSRFRFPEQAAPPAADEAADWLAMLEREIAITREPRRAARLRVEAGRAAERAGLVERAREHFEDAHQADPQYLPAARAMRRLCARLGDFRGSLPYLDVEIALSAPAERAALAAYRADLLVAVGEQDLARVAFGELLDARPDDVRSLLAQVELAYADGRHEELLPLLERLAAHVSDAELAHAALALRGRLLQRAGRIEDAFAAYAAAREADASSRPALLSLGLLALRAGRLAESAACDAHLVEGTREPAIRAAVHRRRGLDLLRAGNAAVALVALEAAWTVAPGDPLVLEALAEAQRADGRAADATRTLRAWADVEGDSLRRAEVLRRAAALAVAPDERAALLAAAFENDPADPVARAELEDARLRAGELEAALALCRVAAEADPDGAAHARYRAARLLSELGRHDEAIAELEPVAKPGASSPALVLALARLYAQAGRKAELSRLLSELSEADDAPDPRVARIRAARAAEALGVEAAETAWRRVLDLDPDARPALAGLLRAAEGKGDPDALLSALAAAQRACRDPSRAAVFALRRAAILLSGASPDEEGAIAALDELRAADPTDPRACALLAALAAHAGRWAEAAAVWVERARALGDAARPEKDALLFRAASTLVERAGELASAAPLLAPVVAARPAFAGARELFASIHRRLGDSAALAEVRTRELQGAGETVPALRFARLVRLADVVAGLVGDHGRAAELYRTALEIRPNDPLALDGFRRAAAASGDVAPLADLALADLKRAEAAEDQAAKIAAYEELARIDADLRGDVASSALAWSAIAELDPTHAGALRALERHFLVEGRTADLLALYAKLGATLVAVGDVVAMARTRGDLLWASGATTEAHGAWREVLDVARPYLRQGGTVAATARLPLFHLQSRARELGAAEELALLDEDIAVYFAGEARAHAAFLTRAGESWAELGRIEEAILRYREAATVLPGYTPALRAWRRLALQAERWTDVAEAAEKEAASATTDEERARLYHLAAIAAMDRALDGERAVADLRRVLAIDPRHDDAFRRLRGLLEEQGRYEDLVQALELRIELEPEGARKLELHETLARLYRDHLGDGERAKAHLRAVLARDGRRVSALAALADLAWAEERWAEAAEALIARARVDKDPAAQKDIFFRLGTIYADKLPDPRWAMKAFERVLALDGNDVAALERVAVLAETLGEHRIALGASDRLVRLTTDPGSRTRHLHRIASLYEQGFQDKARAEEAYRRALDLCPTDERALDALVAFYQRHGDLRSLRVHMDRVAGSMRVRLRKDAFDAGAYPVLSRALAARAQAGVLGSLDAARAAAEIAQALGVAGDAERALAAEAAQKTPSCAGLGDLGIDEVLFHPSIPNGFRQIFRLLHEVLPKRFPADLKRYAVGKAERVPRGGHPLRDAAEALASELRAEFELYVSAAQPTVLAVEPTEPVSVIVGTHLLSPEKPAQIRFAVGRALKLAASYMAIPARLTPDELGVFLAGVIRQFDPTFAPPGLALGEVAEEQQRLARLIPKRLRDELHPFAAELSGGSLEPVTLWRGVQHTGNRAGLLCAGTALAGLVVLLRIGNHRDLPSARGDVFVEELLRFAVSDEHCELRRMLAG